MPSEMMLTLLAVFLTVALVSGALATVALAYAAPGRRRLRMMGGQPTSALLKAAPSLTPSMTVGAQRLARFIPKSPKEMTRLQKRMALAGYHGFTPALIFAASELVIPMVLVGGMLLFGPPGAMRLMLAVFCGMYRLHHSKPGPSAEDRQAQKDHQNGLPDALDLFIVCLEAGSSLDQAILKTSQDLDVPYPPLAEELRMITTETRAGKPRLDAFKNFATRCGVDDVRALVAMLVQADRFGTSIAQALRTHAETSRTKRRQRAEERAGKIGVKLVFPLVFCLFPAFMVVTAGPGVIQLIRFFERNQ